MSTTRKVKSIILQLFAVRHALKDSLKDNLQAFMLSLASNGVDAVEVCGTDEVSMAEGNLKRATGSGDVRRHPKEKSKKGKHSRKRRKKETFMKAKHHKHVSNYSDSGSSGDFLSLGESEMKEIKAVSNRRQWRVTFGDIFADCTDDECAECLHMIVACNRMAVCLRTVSSS
jgi:hypothetical protein